MYASTNDQWARPTVSLTKTKQHQFSSVQLRRFVRTCKGEFAKSKFAPNIKPPWNLLQSILSVINKQVFGLTSSHFAICILMLVYFLAFFISKLHDYFWLVFFMFCILESPLVCSKSAVHWPSVHVGAYTLCSVFSWNCLSSQKKIMTNEEEA